MSLLASLGSKLLWGPLKDVAGCYPGRNENSRRSSSAGRMSSRRWHRGRFLYFEACTVGATMATIACLYTLVKGLYWIRKTEPQKIWQMG